MGEWELQIIWMQWESGNDASGRVNNSTSNAPSQSPSLSPSTSPSNTPTSSAPSTVPSWSPTEVEDEEFSKGLLGIALGTSATTHGMLTNGILYDAAHGFSIGYPLYLTGDAGLLSTTAPTASGSLVRVVGYAIDTDEIYFCPDPTWVLID